MLKRKTMPITHDECMDAIKMYPLNTILIPHNVNIKRLIDVTLTYTTYPSHYSMDMVLCVTHRHLLFFTKIVELERVNFRKDSYSEADKQKFNYIVSLYYKIREQLLKRTSV